MNIVRKLTSTGLSFLGFALCCDLAYAVGLGPIQLHSYLNDPLEAEITLEDTKGIELNELIVHVADPTVYQSMGLEPPSWLGEIRVAVATTKNGQPYILIRTQNSIKDPFADLVIEVAWPGGRLVREYAVLLDPPKVAKLPTTAPHFSNPLAKHDAGTVTIENKAAASAPVTTAEGGLKQVVPGQKYGPISNETLWSIAKKLVQNTPYSIYQGLVAITNKNPETFEGRSVHTLRSGTVLSMPTLEEIAQYQHQDAVKSVKHDQPLPTPTKTSLHSQPINAASDKPLKLVAPLTADKTAESTTATTNEATATPPINHRITLIEEAIDTLKRTNEDIAQKNQHLETENKSLVSLLEQKEQEINSLKHNVNKDGAPADGPFTFPEAHVEQPVAIAKPSAPTETHLTGIPEEPTHLSTNTPVTSAAHAESHLPPPPTLENEPKAPEAVAAAPKPLEKTPPVATREKPVLPQVKEPAMQLEQNSKAKHDVFFLIFILAFIGSICGWLWFSRHQLINFVLKLLNKKSMIQDLSVHSSQEPLYNEIHFDIEKALNAVASEEKKIVTPSTKPVSGEGADFIKNALEEAEIYIAYERYAQAEEVLKNVLTKHPDDPETILKLLQLYVLTEKYQEFKTYYAAVGQQLKEKAPAVWSKIALLVERVETERPLGFSLKTEPEKSPVVGQAESLITPQSLDLPPMQMAKPAPVETAPSMTLKLVPQAPAATPPTAPPAPAVKQESGPEVVVPTLPPADTETASVPAATQATSSTAVPGRNESQLSLAQAFIDIGDIEAARDLLIPILAEGTESEKAQAQQLLDRLNK